jgi:hypothetical protein
MSREHQCLSQLAVERYLLGEMSAAEEARAESALGECEDCAARIAETRADNEAFALRPVPDGVRKLWTDPEPGFRWPRLLAVAVPVAAAAVIAVVLLPGLIGGEGQGGEDMPGIGQRAGEGQTSIKGFDAGIEPSLGFYVLRGGESELGRPGEALKEGDRIQFWYDVPAPAAGVVVGIDGRGAVTRYLPNDGQSPAPLKQGKGHVIESSVILDDAIGVERFYLCVAADADLDPAEVERAARDLAASGVDLENATRLPVECDQASVWIRKE